MRRQFGQGNSIFKSNSSSKREPSRNTLFYHDVTSYLSNLQVILEIFDIVSHFEQSTDKRVLAKHIIDIDRFLHQFPYKGGRIHIEKSASGQCDVGAEFIKGVRSLASELRAILSLDGALDVLNESLIVELKNALPLLFNNMMRFYLEDELVIDDNRFMTGKSYLRELCEEFKIEIEINSAHDPSKARGDELVSILSSQYEHVLAKQTTVRHSMVILSKLSTLLMNRISKDMKNSCSQELQDTHARISGNDKKIETYQAIMKGFYKSAGDIQSKQVIVARILQRPKIPSDKLEKRLEKYERVLTLADLKIDLRKITLQELKAAQDVYDRHHVREVLENIRRRLSAATSKIQALAAIADFVSYYVDQCGANMRQKIACLIPDKYLSDLQHFRNRVMHALDEQTSLESLIKYDVGLAKTYALAFMGNLLLSENADYYLALSNPYSNGLLCITAQFFQSSDDHTQEMEKIGVGLGLPTCNRKQLTSHEQVIFFVDSIRISKAILKAIYAEIDSDFQLGVDIAKVSSFMETVDTKLADDELRIKMKYDALIQALGQSMGNLREYGVLADFYKMSLNRQEFPVLNHVVPLAKEFRNLRTHTGRYHKAAFQGILSSIYQKDHQLQFVVMNELDQLHHKYMTISKELDKQEAPLCCNVM